MKRSIFSYVDSLTKHDIDGKALGMESPPPCCLDQGAAVDVAPGAIFIGNRGLLVGVLQWKIEPDSACRSIPSVTPSWH